LKTAHTLKKEAEASFLDLEQVVFILNHLVVKYESVNLLVFNRLEGDSD